MLANRIREGFDRLHSLKESTLTVSVSYRLLQLFPSLAGASMENMVTSMAANLEASIKSKIIPEAVHHG